MVECFLLFFVGWVVISPSPIFSNYVIPNSYLGRLSQFNTDLKKTGLVQMGNSHHLFSPPSLEAAVQCLYSSTNMFSLENNLENITSF